MPTRTAKTETASRAKAKPHRSTAKEITTDIPARLDRLPWSGRHTRIITALGTSWLLEAWK